VKPKLARQFESSEL